MQAIVMGRNYMSLLSMARCAGMAGCDITIIRTVRNMPARNIKSRVENFFKGATIDRYSRFVKRYLYAIEPNRDSLIQAIRKCVNPNEKSILLPADDFTASTVDMNLETLKDNFYMPSIGKAQGSVVKLMDKGLQKKLAQSVDLPVAKAWNVEIKGGSYTLPDGLRYPVFTKPEISFLGSKTYMKKCDNEADLKSVLNEVAQKSDCPILIEEFVDIEEEYGILGFCDGQNVVIPGIVVKEQIGSGNHKGVTMVGNYVPLSDNDPLKQKLAAFLKKIDFVGLIDIDLYMSNGVTYFNELNLRLGAFGFAAMCAGVNLPQMLIKRLTEEIHEFDYSFEKSIRCINEKVNLDDFAAGFISHEKYISNRMKCDCGFIEYSKDKKPYRVFKRAERFRVFINKLRGKS